MTTKQTNQGWRLAGSLISVLLILTLALYQHTALYLIRLWNQLDIGEYAHGYLVLLISAYLIFDHRQKLSAVRPYPEYWALLLVMGASMLWMIAALVDVETLQAISFLILVFAIVWSVLGNQVIRLLAFPILFITFAIPVWFPLSPVLQNATADVVFGAIRLLSIPALRQDNMIVLPAGALSIEEACSGLRYLLAALTLGTLYAYMNYSSLRARLIVVFVAASLAVLANMLRVFIVVYLGYTTEMKHPLVADHLTLGWYLFAGLVVILLLVDSLLNKKRSLVKSNDLSLPDDIKTNVYRQNYPYYILFVALTGLLIFIAPAVVYRVSLPTTSEIRNSTPELPQEAGDWVQTQANLEKWSPIYHGAVNQKQTYQKGKNKIVLYMGYYAVQKQGEELINDLNHINNNKAWHTVYSRARLQTSGNHQVLEQLLAQRSKQQYLVWYWYNVAGNVTTNKYEAKLLQALELLSGKTWAYVLAVAVQATDDIDASRQILNDFILSLEKPMDNETEQISIHHY